MTPGDRRYNAAIENRNPTGIMLIEAQKDDSERSSYWVHAIEYGLQYYVAGRFATAHAFIPVSANILHHAVELLLKACLAYKDPIEKIRNYGLPPKRGGYRHDISLLWREFKARCAVPLPSEFDAVVEGLHAFEDIRYPEVLIQRGGGDSRLAFSRSTIHFQRAGLLHGKGPIF